MAKVSIPQCLMNKRRTRSRIEPAAMARVAGEQPDAVRISIASDTPPAERPRPSSSGPDDRPRSDVKRRSTIAIFGITMLVWASACGDESLGEAAGPASTQDSETTAPSSTTPTTEDGQDDATPAQSSEPTSVPTTDGPEAEASEVLVQASLSNGAVTVDTRRVEVSTGTTVIIEVVSDETEHVHVHGYDLIVDVGPDDPGMLSFVADEAGSFEVELEDSGRFLFDLLVR